MQFVYRQLRARGQVHRGIIGIRAVEITPELAEGLGLARNWGLLLEDVAPGGPAEEAGLAIGDVVVAMNGRPVGNLAEFVSTLTLRNVGRSVRLDILRGTKALTIQIPVAERPDRFDRLMSAIDPTKPVRVSGHWAPPRFHDRDAVAGYDSLGSPGSRPGGNGGSVASGLMPGDVIHTVNRKRVTNLDELRAALRELKVGSVAVLQIERQGVFKFLQFEIE